MPTAETVSTLLDFGLAVLLIVGGYMEWYVWGPAHRRRIAEKDEEARFWRTAALRSTGIAELAVDAREREQRG